MKHRYNLDPPAKLVDRQGNVAGVISSITLDLNQTDPVEDAQSSLPLGGKGELLAVGEQQTSLTATDARGAGEKIDAPLEVWKHYCSVMQPRHQGIGPQERAIIREALKIATLSECKRAIDGCAASKFHMGDNERHKKYNALSQILKGKRGGKTTREQIDMFLEIAEKSGLPSGVTSADPAKVSQAKRDVIDAVDFPGDAHVQERGDKAKAWLEGLGYKIGRNPETDRPTFTVDSP